MSGNIINITDRKEIEKVFKNFFSSNKIFLKTGECNICVDFVDFKEEQLFLKIQESWDLNGPLTVYINYKGKLICSELRLLLKMNEDLYAFKTGRMRVIPLNRKEDRKIVASSTAEKRDIIYISEIISDFVLKECLKNERRKIDFIEDQLLGKLKRSFAFSKIFFSNEKSYDERMKYFYTERKPIFISDVENIRGLSSEELEFHKYYKSSIYDRDNKLSRKAVSEISVPFLYKGMIPFGYLQVNNTSELMEKDLLVLKKLGVSTSELFSNNNIIKTCSDRFAVSDISKNGLGIVFNDRTHIKHFKDESYLFFKMFFPMGNSATVLCIVRNINMIKNNLFKIGCEVLDIDALGEVHYDEYLESIGKPVSA